MKALFLSSYKKIVIFNSLFLAVVFSVAQTSTDTAKLRFPLIDRRGDAYSWRNKNTFDLRDSSYLNQKIEYDTKTKSYVIIEKIGKRTYRKPTFLTQEEFFKIKTKQDEATYFKQRADALIKLNKVAERPKPTVYPSLFDRTFGLGNFGGAGQAVNDKIKSVKDGVNNVKNTADKAKSGSFFDIKPTGNIDVLLGYQGVNTLNPTLPERARKTGGFDFDMNANVGVNANIGDKLKLPINYNTLANVDYLNQIKLDYKGSADEILKSVEAGNISFQTKSTLIPSAQNLFGVKAQVQFGKLFVTAAFANQRSQRQSQALQGGAAVTTFQKKLSEYEENKHFLLGQYFYNNYNKVMSRLPVSNSQVTIQRIEVWVTNRTGVTTDARDIVGLADLGENNTNPNNLPDNGSNSTYGNLISNPANRQPSKINAVLLGLNLKPVDDYEKTFARKLNPNEYFFNPQAGFISINGQLQPDEVLAVAYQYTYNGRVYKVGEFSSDVALDTTKGLQGVQKVLFLKLLKATSARINKPIWKLMMKNVYSLDLAGISKDGFYMNVLYEQPSGGLNRYLPESNAATSGKSLLSILNMDRLNSRLDPQPDGVFDFVEGSTILAAQGKLIFPLIEPFGKDLDTIAFGGMLDSIKRKYVFRALYDSIKAIAQTYANLDRFVMQGQAKGTGGSDIFLGAFNIPPGSVRVTAGSQILLENIDYTVDYNLGSVKILNSAVLASGVPVHVSFENNAGFGLQQRGFMGLRLDYNASKNFSIGATMERLNERPFFTKMNIGEDPIRNTIYGVDFTYKKDLPQLTKFLNKLPFYNSKAMSSITAFGEGAYFKPGHPPQIGTGSSGLIYVDDFEGARNSLDLRFPAIAWTLASTPQGVPEFPEATLTDSLDYGFHRAKLAWYNIEPNLQDKNSSTNPLKKNLNALSDPRVRQVYTNELFPQQSLNITNTLTSTFDLAYYPTDPGPYNFETSTANISANGKFKHPKNNWGGIMRAIDQTDFETNNFEFIEFWIQDPFIKNPNSTGGKLKINLGSISEDILKDGKRFFENGLPTPTSPAAVDTTSKWGSTPINPIQVTNAFSNDPSDRVYQDVGFDGLNDADEKVKRKADYLDKLANNFGITSPLYIKASNDPSNDDYVWYRDPSYDANTTGILGRYKDYNNPQGNSPIATSNTQFSPAVTLYPDNEDLNRDNTLNETEEYYDYEIPLQPGMTKYITDVRLVKGTLANGNQFSENWYLFRIPIKGFTGKVGNIPDFKSIRFVRMYMTGFEDSTVLRFAKLDLVRNQWRQFAYDAVDTSGGSPMPIRNPATTTFNTLAVNLEENSSRTPVNYLVPPGIERVQQLSNNGVNLLQNEQALAIRVGNLEQHDIRSVFKTVNLDMRQFGKLSMFTHAENYVSPNNSNLVDGDLNLVVRIGQDFLNNYYEVKIPLKITQPAPLGGYSKVQANIVWPDSNNLDFDLQQLINVKLERNLKYLGVNQIYRKLVGARTFSVMGNPNLGEVRGIMLGVENNRKNNTLPANFEVWVNELRLSEITEVGAYAATGRVDVTLADLGKVSVSASMHTQGFGSLESRIQERQRDNLSQFDASLTIDAGKLLPKKAKLSIPVFASISSTVRTPQYDPYDKDVLYKSKLDAAGSKFQRDSIKDAAADQTTIKSINFTNVKVAPSAKPKLWSISNFDVSYSYTQTLQSSPTILRNEINKWRGGLGYTFNTSSKYKEPFKKLIKGKSKWWSLIKDFNFNPVPSLLSFRADVNRQFGLFVPRIVNTDLTGSSKIQRVDTTYDKYFTFDRFYNMRWDLTRSINVDFNATNNARVDEPAGALDTKAKRDTVKNNFWNGGRNTVYNQKAIASYTFPLSKMPFADWITGRYSYGTSYSWFGASRVAVELGNTLENSQEQILTGQFDFNKLYTKSRFLRNLDNASIGQKQVQNNNAILGKSLPTKDEALNGLTGKKRTEALKKWRQQRRDFNTAKNLQKQNQPMEIAAIPKTFGKLLTMIKTVGVNYSENYRSRIPGYMDSTKALGQNFKSMQPGLDYVFGRQPDTNWLNQKARSGLITRDSTFNSLLRLNYEQKFTFTAQVEPVKELMIDINLDKSFSKEYTELFKDTLTNNSSNVKQHLNPYASGGFSVSYIAFNTLFEKTNANVISATFHQFEANRAIISQRIATSNPYWDKTYVNGYASGYGKYAQDVLIPAFLAAYTKQDPNKIALIKQNNNSIRNNPFSGILPRPNWKINYTGLSKIPALAKIFSSIHLSHGYNGTLSMNSYTSALNYYDPGRAGYPSFIDTVSKNYVPFFLVPNITIQEQFSPLFGFDITTTNQMNFKFEYKKSRQMSLSLVDYQLSETNSTEWVVGGSFRKKGVKLPFKLPFMKNKKLENDLNVKLDISMRDDITTNSRLDNANAYGTGGQKVITIQPSIDYVISNRINVKLFFDQRRVTPYISTSAPTINTRAGFQIRISLAP